MIFDEKSLSANVDYWKIYFSKLTEQPPCSSFLEHPSPERPQGLDHPEERRRTRFPLLAEKVVLRVEEGLREEGVGQANALLLVDLPVLGLGGCAFRQWPLNFAILEGTFEVS